jgi:cyclase
MRSGILLALTLLIYSEAAALAQCDDKSQQNAADEVGTKVPTLSQNLFPQPANGLTGAKMAAQPADGLPTDTYSGGTKTVQVGGRKAVLNHVYNAHTDGDTWVYFDDANVLDTGDTFGNTGRYNTIDFANGGDIRGLIRAADAYIKVSNDQTKIVPGHGKLANKADMIAWREMLVTSRDRIQKLVNEGKTEQEVLAAKPLADLDAKWAANPEQAQNWTRMVYNSFTRS